VATVFHGDYEWDDLKAESNLATHGVSFAEATTVFDDPRVAIVEDGGGTERLLAIGMSVTTRILCVVHVERGRRERIISARRASSAERDIYVKESQ
jgi:uncharacterized DUF497 family protein